MEEEISHLKTVLRRLDEFPNELKPIDLFPIYGSLRKIHTTGVRYSRDGSWLEKFFVEREKEGYERNKGIREELEGYAPVYGLDNRESHINLSNLSDNLDLHAQIILNALDTVKRNPENVSDCDLIDLCASEHYIDVYGRVHSQHPWLKEFFKRRVTESDGRQIQVENELLGIDDSVYKASGI